MCFLSKRFAEEREPGYRCLCSRTASVLASKPCSLCCLLTLPNEEETFTHVFDHLGAMPELCYSQMNSSNSTWAPVGFTKAIQEHVQQMRNGSRAAQALLFL